jgi:hypothetical protein
VVRRGRFSLAYAGTVSRTTPQKGSATIGSPFTREAIDLMQPGRAVILDTETNAYSRTLEREWLAAGRLMRELK